MQNPKKQPQLLPTTQMNVLSQLRAQQSSLPPLRPSQSAQSAQLLQTFVARPLQISKPLQLSQQLRSQQPSPQSATPSQVLAMLLESQPQLRPQVSSQRPQLSPQRPQLSPQRSQQVNQFAQLLQPSRPPQLVQPIQLPEHSPVNDLNFTAERIEMFLQRKKDVRERFDKSIRLLECLLNRKKLHKQQVSPNSVQQSRTEQNHRVMIEFFATDAAPVAGSENFLDKYEAYLSKLVLTPGWSEKLKLFEREQLAESEVSLNTSFGKLIAAIENATSPKNAPMYAQNVKFISDAMAVLIPEPYQAVPKRTADKSRKEPMRSRAVRIIDNRFSFKSVSIRKVFSPNQPLDPPFSLSVRLSDYHPFDFALPNLPTVLLHIPFDYNDRRNARLTFDESWSVTPLFVKVCQRYEQIRMKINNQDFHSLLESFYQAVMQTCLGGSKL